MTPWMYHDERMVHGFPIWPLLKSLMKPETKWKWILIVEPHIKFGKIISIRYGENSDID